MASRSASNSTFSVIGSDVTIKGDITASADLHVDGSIEGDLHCASLVQGESSIISGGIEAQTARLAGKVVGSIRAKELVVLKSARIEGDVHYDALTIEQGAHVDGRFAHSSPKAAAPAAPRPQQQQAAPTGDKPASPDEPKLTLAS
ncbi:polymer-forming cytoskeletal protein [Altererythrobacter arenosus]|uniref:Polymer-forming cytoskeletal protein n=1 Tax=Altererythrobacter arenosus TaxID=3032592 RepID=A0ABY8FXH1_9SPHN|nr:polymer-forming cytoskeletal protein [Altererythrobacter sp. CAU 1644]WFL78693.1 polymer-forming cytoskeletal protein [Altererythrobacter sp. CAU 1644]